MTPTRRILGISDSKSVFVSASEQPGFLQLIRDLTNKAKASNPSICYIGAAKGDRPERASAFFKLAEQVGFHPTSLDMYAMETGDPRAYFPNTDAIFIDGGVTRNLIALLKEWDVVDALVQTYQRGTLIAGASAGISMLFDWCISDSIKSSIQPVRGIGLLQGSVCAHYNALEARRNALAELVQSEPNALPAIGIDDGVAALFENESLLSTYTIKPAAKLHLFKQAHSKHTTCSSQTLAPRSLQSITHEPR